MSTTGRDNFASGGMLFVLGLYLVYKGQYDGALVLMGFGIVLMATSNNEWAQQVWDLFFGGFIKLVKKLFGNFFQ